MADPPPSEPKPSGFSAFWQELRRRHVVRVAAVYLVVGWLVIQVANATFEDFGIPVWAYRFVVLMVALGFPISVVLAWAFELTPEGIKTTKTAKVQHPDSHENKSHVKKRHWFSLGMAAAVPTLIFGVLALVFYIRLGSDTEADVVEKSIAVLPLENMSPDPENAFFADGVQEDILTNLARIDELHVIARTSTQQYRDTTKTVDLIGRELGISYLVEGSVRRAGNQVKVTVQLIECVSGNHIWADDYNRSLDDIFEIQAEIAKEIAGQLHAALSPKEIEKIEYRPTQNQAAYDAYVQARQAFEVSGHRGSIDFSREAVRLDPQFAEAWVMLAYDAIVNWNYGSRRTDEELLDTARMALANAERLAPDTPMALFARSVYLTHHDADRRSAINLLLRAVTIDPNSYFARKELGILNHMMGRLPEAQYHYEATLLNDPLSSHANSGLVAVLERRELWDEAQAQIEKNIEKSENKNAWKIRLAESKFLRTGDKRILENAYKSKVHPDDDRSDLWLALQARDYPQVVKSVEEVASLSGNFSVIDYGLVAIRMHSITMTALAWFELGDINQARAVAERYQHGRDASLVLAPEIDAIRWSDFAVIYALEGNSVQAKIAIEKARQSGVSPEIRYYRIARAELFIALAYIVLDDKEKAIKTLESLKDQECAQFVTRELQLWPFFDRLKGDPRFDALLNG